MKKNLTIGILLLTYATLASAEWTLVGGDNTYNQYVDAKTYKLNGKFPRIWTLRDYGTLQNTAGIKYFYETKLILISSVL